MVFLIAAEDVDGAQINGVGTSLQYMQFELRFAVFIAPPVTPAIRCSGVDEGAAEDGLFGDRFVVAVLCEVVNQEDRYSKS